MAERQRMSNRRPHIVAEIADSNGELVTIGLGFSGDGRCKEIFISGYKAGSDIQSLLTDAGIIASIAMQHGVPLAALATSMGWTDEGGARVPTSPLGLALVAALGLEETEGAEIAAAQAAGR